MTELYQRILRRHAHALKPLPTDAQARLGPLEGVRGVFWDVYGTMFISFSGEVGTVGADEPGEAFGQAMRAAGLDCALPSEEGVGLLHETIRAHHERQRGDGIEYPEVDIVAIWRDVLEQLQGRSASSGEAGRSIDYARLAVEYEARANPVWPMPHLARCLAGLARGGMLLGIISNAQFFTVELFPAFLGQRAEEVGFDPNLQYYSYRYLRAKPGGFLYQQARDDLSARGVDSGQIVYVGNDMLNDILPAKECGFRTALFAGDARSLRLRSDDPRVRGVAPDVVLTDLGQLWQCLRLPDRS
jgi:putative hydrolase of the HAD superfamily